MVNVIDVLAERGFIKQTTHDEPLRKLLSDQSVTVYTGFDPTADSLHVGHIVAIMALAHMQRHGHRPIAILGGGTALIGDPSGKTELRQMLTREQIAQNVKGISAQIGRYLDFGNGKALTLNNADWLSNINYIDFLRDTGVHFSVNRMLSAECYKGRMEKGLSFIEFNYMLLQSYDYLYLQHQFDCRLQMGGDDQWSNILAGADLIRRVGHIETYGITFPLLTTSGGKKMGKTEEGAVWLATDRTSPYDFYQYWRNTHDLDVERFLAIFTFLPMEEVRRLGALKDREINEAKKILAMEATKLAHGEAEALKAKQAAEALFSGAGEAAGIPTVEVEARLLVAGVNIAELLVVTGITVSKGEGRRLIQGGGIYINEKRIDSPDALITDSHLQDGKIAIRKGKKQFTYLRPV
ncbi:MAG: tyrosyl-tRNA synthetase [Bacillota bacterium]|nr:MAG: tyrosyl-tRNA synthetase [Bacillota bacterium]